MTSKTFTSGTTIDSAWLNDVNTKTYGNAFIQSGTGAIARTDLSKMRESVSVLDFGADPTGVADSTTAIQAAITSIPLSGGGLSHGYVLYFTPGKYKITSSLVVGNRRLTFYAPSVMGSGSSVILSASGSAFTMIDFSTGNSDVIAVMGIEFSGDGAHAIPAISLGSAAQTCYDSRIWNCWFSNLQAPAVIINQGYDNEISDCGFDSGNTYGIQILTGDPFSAYDGLNTISNNVFYGQSMAGVYINNSSNNLITGNIFFFCGSQVNDTTAGVLIDRTGSACRATQIVGNKFKANGNDIVLNGHGGVYSANTGVLDTWIQNNTSDRNYRHFVYATDSHQMRITGNAVALPSGGIPTYNAFDINGTSDSTFLDSNSTNTVSGIGALYGLSLASTTTNTVIGTNVFQGTGLSPLTGNNSTDKFTGANNSITIASGATWTSTGSLTGTWTPTIGGNATYTVQEGYFVKNGNTTYAQAKLVINVIGTGSAGIVSGLPFPVFNATNAEAGGGQVTFLQNSATAVTSIVCAPVNNTSTVQFNGLTAAAATMSANISVYANTARTDFSVVYRSAY